MMAFKLLILLILAIIIPFSTGVLDHYLPALDKTVGNTCRDDLIEQYFRLGLQQSEILLFLVLKHGIVLSIRQLKRILARKGLRRRKDKSDLETVLSVMEEELKGSGSVIGYRRMWQKLITEHHLVVSKETVRHALRVLDPIAVNDRLKHRLQRRQYRGRGPNFIWHIDGYDKLKPFGFCIHGCIDGFSRRIMWLEVGTSNNDPSVVSQYFIDCIRDIGGVPCVVRSDCGTENGNVASIQHFLRLNSNDSLAGEKSFMYGKSISNQRIEAWWSQLRRGGGDWWIRYFKELRDNGLYCDADIVQVECLRFCFMAILRQELQSVAKLWNVHRIRPSTNRESPPGRPDVLYCFPQMSGTNDFKIPTSIDDIEICAEVCSPSKAYSDEISELAQIIMNERGLQMPLNPQEAKRLYLTLIDEINQI